MVILGHLSVGLTLVKLVNMKLRARWKRLGRSRGRVYRIVISDPVKVVIIGARVTAGLGVQP